MDKLRIIVTGSEGNIGSRLIPYLRLQDHLVFRIDQIQKYEADYMVANINNVGDLFEAFSFKPDICIHLAAMVSRVTCEQSPFLTVDTNLSGLNNIIQVCKAFNTKLIYFSTSEVYGNIGGYLSEDRQPKPNNRYGLTKYLGEKLVEYEVVNGLKAIIVRPFMFYDELETRGEHRSAMIRFAENLSLRHKITVHKGSLRSWLHMSDAVRFIEKIIHIDSFEIVNIGTSEIVLTEDLAKMMCDYFCLEYSKYVYELPLPDKMTLEKYPDIRKLISLTGIEPKVTFKEGVKRVLESVKKY